MRFFVPALDEQRVRAMTFRARSDLPVSAACALANALQDALGGLARSDIRLRLFEPVVPEPDAWPTLLRNTRVYAVRGSRATAAFVLREPDAAALVRLALAETAAGARELSKIEAAVVDRLFGALAPALTAVCGAHPHPIPAPGAFLTYFELTAAPAFRIGVALSPQEADAAPARTLSTADLAGVPVELRVELATGVLTAGEVLALHPGRVVPMTTRVGEPGVVRLAGAALARGQCGTAGTRYALVIQE